MGQKLKIIETSRTKVTDKSSSFGKLLSLSREINISFFKFGFKDKRKESLFSEMGILLSSGLDINSSFKVIIEQANNEEDRLMINQIYNELLKGRPIHECFAKSGKFSQYDYFCLKIGEESGQLNEVLYELGSYYTRKIKYKRKFINAMTYPIVVLVTALASVVFMLNFLVPMFEDIFNRTNSELPALTKFIISLSKITSEKLPLLILIIAGIIGLYFLNRKKEYFRRKSSALIIRIPVLGELVKLFYMERFIISMVLLTKSKVTIVKALNLVKNIIDFYPLEIALFKIESEIIHGKLLYESMASFPIFDKKIVSMVKVGEEVNKLGLIFEKLGKQYSEDLEYRINNVNSLLEPILIIFVGIIVGIILISMYLPIFQIGSTIS